MLSHSNQWQRRMAQRILSEKLLASKAPEQTRELSLLSKVLTAGKTLDARLAALWTLHNSGMLLSGDTLETALASKDAPVRAWAIRFAAETIRADPARGEDLLQKIETATSDPDPSVRLAVATAARQLVSGSLTVDTETATEVSVGKILTQLVMASADAKDPLLPFMIWTAAEPSFAKNPGPGLDWLAKNGSETLPLSATLARKAMRRICDTQDGDQLDAAVTFLNAIAAQNNALVIAALEGLIEGQRAKPTVPSLDTKSLFSTLSENSNPLIKERGQELGTLWGNAASMQATLSAINNAALPIEQRLQSIKAAQQLKNDAARDALLKAVGDNNPEPLVIAAIRGLGQVGGDPVSDDLLKLWNSFTPGARAAAADVLVSRRRWAISLLSALEAKTISSMELPLTAIRALGESKDEFLRQRAEQVIGRIRPANADKQQIIEQKKKMILAGGAPNLGAGHELARKTCLTCHKLYSEGAEVGPDLTGVGRSSLEALLANVIDPNQVIGKGYENVMIDTKDGRSVSGRLVENSDSRVKLLAAGPKEEVVAKSDIASMRTSELSVMPEGLEQMPDADFRNLILYVLHPPQEK
jgi:putative heme-binding domain-containing protein